MSDLSLTSAEELLKELRKRVHTFVEEQEDFEIEKLCIPYNSKEFVCVSKNNAYWTFPIEVLSDY